MTEVTGEKPHVLDASALLCLLFNEPGAGRVEALLSRALVSVANYHEVLAMLVDRGVDPGEARMMLGQLDIEIIAADRDQADVGGALRSITREAGLSLGDRCCLALAQVRHATAVTCNPAWSALSVGIEIEVVR